MISRIVIDLGGPSKESPNDREHIEQLIEPCKEALKNGGIVEINQKYTDTNVDRTYEFNSLRVFICNYEEAFNLVPPKLTLIIPEKLINTD